MMTPNQKDYRDDLAVADAMAKAAKDLAAAVESSMKAAALVWEYNYTVSQALPLLLALSTQRFVAPAAKAEVGDLVFIHPAGRPMFGGVSLGGLILQATGFVNAKGTVDVNYVLPILTTAGSLSMPIRLRGFRPAAS